MCVHQVGEGSTVVEDVVYGSVTFDNSTITDQVPNLVVVGNPTHSFTCLHCAGPAEE